MAPPSGFTLYQAVVDVQYDRGVVFLDRCGSLMLKLQGQLGEPFQPSGLPTMEFGELQSPSERIVARFGSKSINLTHAWPPSPVRLEQLAPPFWDEVAETLAVSRHVTRCAARYQVLWGLESLKDARERVKASHPFARDASWRALAGDQNPHGWSATVDDTNYTVRVAVDAVELNQQKALLPMDLVDIVPKFAVTLDVDCFRGAVTGVTKKHFTLPRTELKEFLRHTWQRTKAAAKTMTELLEIEDDGERDKSD